MSANVHIGKRRGRLHDRTGRAVISIVRCGAAPVLCTLLGCEDAGVVGRVCELDGCDTATAARDDAGTDTPGTAVQDAAATVEAMDGGDDLSCRATYVFCIAFDPTDAGIGRCGAEAATCGFYTDGGLAVACASLFAECLATKPLDQCRDEFEDCLS